MTKSSADTELIGWALNSHTGVFHAVRPGSTRADGTGMSICGAHLVETAPPSAARKYERLCADCGRPRKPPPTKKPRDETEAAVPERSRAPVQPQHVRVTPNGELAIRIDGRTGWVVLDATTGAATPISEQAAKPFPTLRSLWPIVDLIGGRDLAAELEVSLTAVSQMQKRHDDFPEPNVRLGDRNGWYPERLEELLSFILNRRGRGGGERPPSEPGHPD